MGVTDVGVVEIGAGGSSGSHDDESGRDAHLRGHMDHGHGPWSTPGGWRPGEVFFRTTNKSSPKALRKPKLFSRVILGCSLSQLATPPSHYEYMYRLPNATRRTTYIRSIRPKPPPGATAGAAPGA